MKRRVVKLSLVILVLIVMLLGLLAFLSRDSGRLRGFQFLGNPDLVVHRDAGRSRWKMTLYYYCLEADVNDVCAKADAGLSAMDIVNRQEWTQKPRGSRYILKGKGPGEWITVSILDGRKLSAHSISKLSESPSLDHRNMYDREKGWVAISVTRAQLRSWPPRHLLNRLKVRLGIAPNPSYPGG